MLRGIFPVIAWLWRPLQTVAWVLSFCRFNVFLLAAGGVLLLLTSQGQEITLRVTDNFIHTVAFFIGVLLWAFHSWFWSRYLINDSPAAELTDAPFVSWLVRNILRIIGLGAFALATAALYMTWKQKDVGLNDPHGLCMLISGIFGILFYLFLTSRFGINPDADWQRSGTTLRYLRKRLNFFTFIYGSILTLGAFTAPAYVGFMLGSGGIFFLALSSIAPVGNWLIYQTSRQGFPVIITLLLLAVVFSFINDNHELRSTDTQPKLQPLQNALARWAEQAPLDIEQVHPFIIVATAGGGLRAAHWTGTVLAGLIDAEPRLRNALFAISGVSGGSVGATFTQAVLREDDHHCEQAAAQQRMRGDTCYEWQVRTALSRDFLAPLLAGFMYPDLMQRFLPFPVNALPDRAEALETGWEVGWRAIYSDPKTSGLTAPFTALWDNAGQGDNTWLPALLLNSTHQETGKRLITSNLDITVDVFDDVIGLYNVLDFDVYASTAAHNSARFPYISPPGTLTCRITKDMSVLRKFIFSIFGNPLCNYGHVLDGAYFENFGAVTALKLLQAAVYPPYRPGRMKLRPIVILISSDPELVIEDEQLAKTNDGIFFDKINLDRIITDPPGRLGANETLGPVKGLLSPRTARGILAAKELRQWINRCKAERRFCGGADYIAEPAFFHFRMQTKNADEVPALGWLLSEQAESRIWNMLGCVDHNRRELETLLRLFGTSEQRISRALGNCS